MPDDLDKLADAVGHATDCSVFVRTEHAFNEDGKHVGYRLLDDHSVTIPSCTCGARDTARRVVEAMRNGISREMISASCRALDFNKNSPDLLPNREKHAIRIRAVIDHILKEPADV